MRGQGAMGLIVAAAIALGCAAPAFGQTQPAASVNAEGNFINPAGLRFNPAAVSVPVGGVVRWTNTDFLVPHTATEDHGLWNLTGNDRGTPFSPPGFGPGQSRERPFEAGTWSYFCEVHPVQMRGTVTVPMQATAAGKGSISAVWSKTAPGPGQVFDVEMSKGGAPFTLVRDGTSQLQDTIRTLKKKRKKKGKKSDAVSAKKRKKKFATFTLRAKVRAADEPARASGFSPSVSVLSRVR